MDLPSVAFSLSPHADISRCRSSMAPVLRGERAWLCMNDCEVY